MNSLIRFLQKRNSLPSGSKQDGCFAGRLSCRGILKKMCFLLLTLLLMSSHVFSQVLKTNTLDWVKKISYSSNNEIIEDGGYQFFLLDYQDNLINESVYVHSVVKVFNSSGIQEFSAITTTFDPAYQQLEFHCLQIIRDGKIIDKLKSTEIETFQRETSLERHIYDGTLTASINLSDVRQNDIIEYAYTTKGFNPVNDGHYSSTYYFQLSIPVSRIFVRIIAKSAQNLQYKLFNEVAEPKITKANGQVEYVWDTTSLDFLICDINTPDWFNPYKRVKLSTFRDWKAVVDWAVPLYTFDENEIDEIFTTLENEDSNEARILGLIRMVQDEIRYLGFESGISAYKPNSPSKVYNQKYGDCKDKSLLLVSLLQHEGFEAYPLLINTFLMDEAKKTLPENSVFNHCVVYLKYDNDEYFIDPTISEQGGDLENFSFPDYKYGLLVKPGQDNLIEIPDGKRRSMKVTETISVDTIGGDARLKIITEYSGILSDYFRNYFNAHSKDEIKKEFLDYYSSLHSKINSVGYVKFDDRNRNTTNITSIEENYLVKDFWLTSEGEKGIYCELYPLELESQITYSKSANRLMPYKLSSPYSFDQSITVILPEKWDVNDEKRTIEGDGFSYKETINGKGKKVLLNFNYEVNKAFIHGDAVESFLKKHDEIRKNLTYKLSYSTEPQGFKLSWLALLFILSVVGVGTFLARKLYFNFDPKGNELAANLPIGSWLVLPAFGLIASPFMILYNLGVGVDFFDQQYWNNLQNLSDDKSVGIVLFVGAEIASYLLLIIFDIVVTVLFFKRRTSVPGLISILYLVGIFVPVIDIVISQQLFHEIFTSTENDETYKIARSAFFGFIWITYFNVSQRVRDTFCIRINQVDEETDDQEKLPVEATKPDEFIKPDPENYRD